MASKDLVVELHNVQKTYQIYKSNRDRVVDALTFGKLGRGREFNALSDINLKIGRGESIGLIGRNGSGKSTLLKLIAGVISPTAGSVRVSGRVSALLELGAGFHPEFNGIDNVYFSGFLNGYSREQMESRLDDILGFADIGEFVHAPVKTYSSGMFVRLAFAVATAITPDILIIDEALAVGDMLFQAKSLLRMKKMLESATTVIFVSHDLGSLKSLCKRGVLLDSGRVTYDGDIGGAAERYFHSVFSKTSSASESPEDDGQGFNKTKDFMRVTNGSVEIQDVGLFDKSDRRRANFEFGDAVQLRIRLKAKQDVSGLAYGFHIRDQSGVDVNYVDDDLLGMKLPDMNSGEEIELDIDTKLPLGAGDYTVSVVFSKPIDLERGVVEFCDFVPIAAQFRVNRRRPTPIYGKTSLPAKITMRRIESK